MKLDLQFSEIGKQLGIDFGETSVIHDGQNGATFIPSVSAEGVIYWTNDRDLPNPSPVNIKGEKGDKGDKGERGLQGIQGIQGERGADGAKGDKGDRGEKGERGLQGIQGIQGTKGDKGDTGANGKNGTNGVDGKDGKDGYTPVKGVDYFTEEDIAYIVNAVLAALGGAESEDATTAELDKAILDKIILE